MKKDGKVLKWGDTPEELDVTLKKCPVCGKKFHILDCDAWVYKAGRYGGGGYNYYCSWHCLREDERRHMKPTKPIPLAEADKVPGARRQPMESRALLEKVLEIIEKDGGNAGAEYLESLGYAAWKKWYNLKVWAEKHDEKLLARMPEQLTDRRRKEEQA